MFFDTHAHYDDEAFDADRDEVLSSLPSKGVSLVLNPASNMVSAAKSIALSEKYDYIYAAVGVHPEDAETMREGDIAALMEMAKHPKVKAIGEIGLDYHYDGTQKDLQKKILYDQLCLAEEIKLPVIIHERDACADTLDILRSFKNVRGVVHCFSGSWETAKIILNMGWNISFTGVVTFKNAKTAPEVAMRMPADRIMIETDSPYMAPVPLRGKRNDSSNLVHICGKIADLRGISLEEAAALTMQNGRDFFGI